MLLIYVNISVDITFILILIILTKKTAYCRRITSKRDESIIDGFFRDLFSPSVFPYLRFISTILLNLEGLIKLIIIIF